MTWHTIDGQTPADFWGWGQFAPTKDRVITNRSLKAVAANRTMRSWKRATTGSPRARH